jgi:branched-chain amino acid transport system permease protein
MTGRTLVGVAVVAVAVAPYVVGPYYTVLLLPFFGYSIALLGLNLLLGYTGLLSFGHALFVALGAYTVAALTSVFGILWFEVILLSAAAVALAVAVPVGLLCVRYVKIYFGMLTLAFGMLFYSFLFKFYFVTGGDEGMRVLQPRLLGGFAGLDKIEYLTGPYYYYALALLVLATFVMRRIVTSPFGLYLRSIRENAEKAEYLGVDFRRQRFVAFLIAGVFGAVGGALVIIPTGLADPLLAYWTHSGTLVFMLLLGGFTNFFGPIVGAFVFIFLQDQVMAYTEYWRFIFGAILAVVVIFFPHGVMGLLDPRARAGV